MDYAPEPELLSRYQASLDELTSGQPVGLAVSGGADSVAMLLLTNAVSDVFEVATVDHQLRAGSADDCALVAELCDKLNVPCSILKVDVPKGNLQQEARIARYRALGEWADKTYLAAILTAHHADDQTETLLMRLNRGSGLAGLSGIRERTMMDGCGVPIVRPLLGFRRQELRSVVSNAGVSIAEDPSNQDDRFDRVRIRKALQDADWLDPLAIARSAAHLSSANQSIQAMVLRLWTSETSRTDNVITVPATLLPEVDKRLVQKAIAELGGNASLGEVTKLLRQIDGMRGKANLAGVLVERFDELTICRREPPRKTG